MILCDVECQVLTKNLRQKNKGTLLRTLLNLTYVHVHFQTLKHTRDIVFILL